MSHRLKRQRDGRILACLQSTDGFPAHDIAAKKLGGENLRFAPAELIDQQLLEGDMLVAVIAGSDAARRAGRFLGVRIGALPPSGYRIQPLEHEGNRALLISGGDLFGMLAGLADALLWSELNRSSLVYRGGQRTEKPAFALRYYWTWDHSTNWVLDDPGNLHRSSTMRYCKQPETYLEDFRRLIDHCVDMRFNGIAIWGFLRDDHGGEDYAARIAEYAARRGVAILPGVGTTWYGGTYYEGDHPCNLTTYLEKHPERRMHGTDEHHDGRGRAISPDSKPTGLSPYLPENIEWVARCLEWLYGSFRIGGANLENGDFAVDHSPAAVRERKKIASGEPDFLKDQYFAYRKALETVHRLAPDAWNTYATYCGFGPGTGKSPDASKDVIDYSVRKPYFAERMPASAVAQWTLTHMLRRTPAPLRDWMDSRAPKCLYDNPHWPKGLTPPTPRSAGFVHHASQWFFGARRTDLAMSSFAEACLRSHEAGLEGISVHGEVSARAVAPLLNYLTMRHWTYHPKSTLVEFADAELAPRLGSVQAGRDYVEALCLMEEGDVGTSIRQGANHLRDALPSNDYREKPGAPPRGNLLAARMWNQISEWRYHAAGPWQRGVSDVL